MIDLSKLEKMETEEDVILEIKKAEATKYLSDTDWYVSRYFETKKKIPSEVSKMRAAARETLSI